MAAHEVDSMAAHELDSMSVHEADSMTSQGAHEVDSMAAHGTVIDMGEDVIVMEHEADDFDDHAVGAIHHTTDTNQVGAASNSARPYSTRPSRQFLDLKVSSNVHLSLGAHSSHTIVAAPLQKADTPDGLSCESPEVFTIRGREDAVPSRQSLPDGSSSFSSSSSEDFPRMVESESEVDEERFCCGVFTRRRRKVNLRKSSRQADPISLASKDKEKKGVHVHVKVPMEMVYRESFHLTVMGLRDKYLFISKTDFIWRDIYGTAKKKKDGLIKKLDEMVRELKLHRSVKRCFHGQSKLPKVELRNGANGPVAILFLRYCSSKGDTVDMEMYHEELRQEMEQKRKERRKRDLLSTVPKLSAKERKGVEIGIGSLTNRFVVFIASGYVVTLHRNDLRKVWKLRTKWKKKYSNYTLRHFLNKIILLLLESYEHAIENDTLVMDENYRYVMDATKSKSLIESASRLKRRALVYKRVLSLMKDAIKRFRQITMQTKDFWSEANQDFVDALLDRATELHESADSFISLHISVTEHQANDILNALTFVSVIFLPLSFLTGLYGMNFVNIPELGWHLGYMYFWLLIITCVILITSFFKYKQWF